MVSPPTSVVTNGTVSDTTERIDRLFDVQTAHAPTARQTDAEQRKAKIRRLRDGVVARRDDIRAALHADFRKPRVETDLTEVKAVADEASFAIDHLASWMQPETVKTPPLLLGTRSEIHYQPRGVVLIVSPWNYPFNLTFGPLIAALAAGNCAILKPSEYTPNASRVMAEIVAELFDEREVALVEGDKEVAQHLLQKPFDHFYFTGSPAVGKIVMRAAAKHLSSVTLELGGKSPTIVDDTADVRRAATQIAWGKFTNAGQTCIAPDHVYVHARQHDAFVDALRAAIQRFYGETPQDRQSTPDYARLVNDKHFQRIRRFFDDAVEAGATVAAGGAHDAETRYFAPTVLTDVPDAADVMCDEIFGPLLPVLPFRGLDTVIDAINARPNPLALYLFTQSDAVEDAVRTQTTAGGTCVNDVLLHYMNPHLPFGGAGHSGMGAAHGAYAFREFSHTRSVLKRSYGASLLESVYPPYGALAKRAVDWVWKWL
jgi:aldehyde dehydrogenase (NAD+)